MREVITNWQPLNSITTPITDTPSFINSGIIKVLMKTGEKISIAQIDYQEFDEENFQYIISPYWEIIDGLPSNIFQGIPGINMDLRLDHYYRVNYIPVFITERTPSKNREDLWELLEGVGLDYFDRFEWLLRTNMICGNDNLIVERRRDNPIIQLFSYDDLSHLQYGDTIIVDSLEYITQSLSLFNHILFTCITNGINIKDKEGHSIIDRDSREVMVPVVIVQRNIMNREHLSNRQKGIDVAKSKGKYLGRKL